MPSRSAANSAERRAAARSSAESWPGDDVADLVGEDDGEFRLVVDEGEHAAGDDDLLARQDVGVGIGRIEHAEAPARSRESGGVEQPAADASDIGGEPGIAVDPGLGQRHRPGLSRRRGAEGEDDRQCRAQSHSASASRLRHDGGHWMP